MAEQCADVVTKILLTSETKCMLPSIKDKVKKMKKAIRKPKKKKTKKHSKKSKKKSHKKRKYSTSEDESESSSYDSATDDTNSSLSDNDNKSPSKRNSRKSKATTEDAEDKKKHIANVNKLENPIMRDSWMTGSLMIKTYSKERTQNRSDEKQQIDIYDPKKSLRELNPYWKSTGTGLPSFQKPTDVNDNDNGKKKLGFSQTAISTKGWKKHSNKGISGDIYCQSNISKTLSDNRSSFSDKETKEQKVVKSSISTSEFLTDQQMNELGAKVLKAELMSNMALADELREKLEKARQQRNIFKERQKSAYVGGKHNFDSSKSDVSNTSNNEHILLTHTDQVGNTRPLPPTSSTFNATDSYRGNKKSKRVESHDESGKRVRYFADDDRYDIKQMFEKEKYTCASEANLQFANIAGKHKNLNDDLEDIFAEKICQDDSQRSEYKAHNKYIREHRRNEAVLDNCDKCFGARKMQKELLVCVGEYVYLALPWYQGLQLGHCMIIPTQHAVSCTQIDENVWTEMNEFRKALTRMYAAQHKDVIFFEIANKLHRRPHLVIHCIPINESDGEMAPFYFKKAIEESEYEWCVNKQLVSLRNKSLRNCIPKGLPYFWVNFGMDSGFAHVIEDEERFPPNFAQEIIGGMLKLDANKWRQLKKEQDVINKVKTFADCWKKYDCTV